MVDENEYFTNNLIYAPSVSKHSLPLSIIQPPGVAVFAYI